MMQQFVAKIAPILPKGLAKLESEQVMELAQKASGLSDWGDSSFREGLDMVISCYKKEVPTSFEKRVELRNFLVYIAVMRLRIVDVLHNNPEIAQVPIKKPLIVAGYPRTGTTILQNLLSLDPNAKSLRFWEALIPVPPPEPATYTSDPRIEIATQSLAQFYQQYPIWERIHKLYPEGPQECEQLFVWDFASPIYYARYPMVSYMNWLMDRDMAPSYRFYRQQLQLLSWKFPGKRWMLKAPMHLPFMRGLVDVFPDASIVVTHRDPERVLGSICSLISNTREMCNLPAACDNNQLGAEFFDGMPRIMENYMNLRKEVDPKRFLDLDYRDTVKDPVAQIRRIYEYFDYPWPDGYEEIIDQYMEENKQHKFGKHKYSVTDYGLDVDAVRKRFTTYTDAYPQFFSDLPKPGQ